MANEAKLALLANGNISPSRFVKLDSSLSYAAVQATGGDSAAGDAVIGISQIGTWQAPGLTGSDGYAAIAGKSFNAYGLGQICYLGVGSGGCLNGSKLKSNASGLGIVASTAGDNFGAIALAGADSGDLVRVEVVIGKI